MKRASLVIIERNDQILLGQKKNGAEIGSGTLNGPGGKEDPEKGDTCPADCAIRETWEEFGIALDPNQLEKIAVVTFFAAGNPDFEVHIFWTDSFEGMPHETDEMVIPQWYPVAAIPFDRMLESDAAWVPQAVRKERFRANVFYTKRAQGFERIEFFPWEEL
jgi:8-oxo-dGTP pyrophosphatase MutT (NUDIX family)